MPNNEENQSTKTGEAREGVEGIIGLGGDEEKEANPRGGESVGSAATERVHRPQGILQKAERRVEGVLPDRDYGREQGQREEEGKATNAVVPKKGRASGLHKSQVPGNSDGEEEEGYQIGEAAA